jgi:tellurite resistance protein TerA
LQFSNNPARQGSLTAPPYIYHLGDDRTGGVAEGEFIKVNMSQLKSVRRMTIYAFVYEGAISWKETDAYVTVNVPGQPTLEVRMGDLDDTRKFCAIAGLEFTPDGTGIEVTKLVSFHSGHDDCDKTYGWGMQWRAGSK